MSDNKFADVYIKVPDGHLTTTSVMVNGMDLSRFTNKIEFVLSADEPLSMVTLTLIANVSIEGKLAIKTKAFENIVFSIDD